MSLSENIALFGTLGICFGLALSNLYSENEPQKIRKEERIHVYRILQPIRPQPALPPATVYRLPNISEIKEFDVRPTNYYMDKYESMEPLNSPQWVNKRNWCLRRLMENQERYQNCPRPDGVPWFFIAAIHMMESSGNFDCTISNGRYLLDDESWEQTTYDELIRTGLGKRSITTINDFGVECEAWNGFGYAIRGVDSPYLFSGSTCGVGVGKFIFDGRYDPTFESEQIGTMVLLHDWVAYLKDTGQDPLIGLETFTRFPDEWGIDSCK